MHGLSGVVVPPAQHFTRGCDCTTMPFTDTQVVEAACWWVTFTIACFLCLMIGYFANSSSLAEEDEVEGSFAISSY